MNRIKEIGLIFFVIILVPKIYMLLAGTIHNEHLFRYSTIFIYSLYLIFILWIHFGFYKAKNRLLQSTLNVSLPIFLTIIAIYIMSIIVLLKVDDGTQYASKYLLTTITNIMLISLVEEIAFRKIILGNAFLQSNSKVYAISITTVLFVLSHHITTFISLSNMEMNHIFLKTFALILLSIYLSWVYLLNKSLTIAILVHAGQNTIGFFASSNHHLGISMFFITYLLIGILVICERRIKNTAIVDTNLYEEVHENVL